VELYKDGMVQAAMELCFALQQGDEAKVEELLLKLEQSLQKQADNEAVKSVRNVLSMALRKRSYDVFHNLLLKLKPFLLEWLQQKELMQENRSLVEFIVYSICDRRLTKARALVERIVSKFTEQMDRTALVEFWNEWSSLIARLVRRNWFNEAHWLQRTMLKQLWQSGDLKLVQMVLWQLQMHLAMYSRYESIALAFAAYRPLFYGYLVLSDRFLAKANDSQRLEWLQIALRSLRDVASQMARGKMQEQQEVYHELYELWLEDARGELEAIADELPVWKRPEANSKKNEARIQLWLQMVITYWNLTLPKSSKKQLQYLQDIMEPRRITPECKALLKKLS